MSALTSTETECLGGYSTQMHMVCFAVARQQLRLHGLAYLGEVQLQPRQSLGVEHFAPVGAWLPGLLRLGRQPTGVAAVWRQQEFAAGRYQPRLRVLAGLEESLKQQGVDDAK